ncbi:YhgE/Pip family protein [Gordonia sp. FQ]|uniref:YhgE/Pip family protein n=1 Tax=Gordonia sp. FQ TaxID=3446634 RepID=UPI003F858544
MFAALAPGGDFKRYLRGRLPRTVLVLTIVIPLLYGALALSAVWDPEDVTQNVSVAVVNLDEGATMMGKKLDAGSQVTQALIDSHQLDMHVVGDEEAREGVISGKYYFSITIPEGFSKALASPVSGNAHQAKMVFTYNAANNYLMTMVGQAAAQQIVTTVSTTIGTQTFDVALQEVSKLEPKVKEAAAGINELNDGMQQAHQGAGQLAGALNQVNDAVTRLTTPLEDALAKAPTVSPDKLGAAANQLSTDAATLSKALDAPVQAQSQAAQILGATIAQLRASGDPVQSRLADSLEQARGLLGVPQGDSSSTKTTLARVRDNSALIAGQLGDPHSQVRSVMTMLTDGGLPGDIDKVQSATDQLATGATQLDDGMGQLADGTEKLAGTVDQAVKLLPSWDKEQMEAIAKSLADPVTMKSDTMHGDITLGQSLVAPLFALALFMGAILAWMLFSALQKRPVTFGVSAFRSVLASCAPVFWVGAAQALLLYLVVIAIGLRPQYWVGTFLFMLLMVVMFQSIVQMIYAVVGAGVGRVVSLGLLAILFVLAGGLLPLRLLGQDIEVLHILDPMTYPVIGLQQLTMGGVDHRLWISIGVIVGVTIVCWAISSWMARRNRHFTIFRLYPPVRV